MNKNIMCVCASRDTTNVSIYEVETNESGKVLRVVLSEMNELNMKQSSLVQLIKNTCGGGNISGCIIEASYSGIAIVDTLIVDNNFSTPIYKINCLTTQESSGCICKLREYIKENKIVNNSLVDLNLEEFDELLVTSPTGVISLAHGRNYLKLLDLALFIGNVETYKTNQNKANNRKIIEDNLREILEILVDDLCNADKSNTGTVNDLVRLIDKVNYIRNQY